VNSVSVVEMIKQFPEGLSLSLKQHTLALCYCVYVSVHGLCGVYMHTSAHAYVCAHMRMHLCV
jgi:hypothetical protein